METGLYIVTLLYTPEGVGAGTMTIQLAVNTVNGTLHGQAHGIIHEGQAHQLKFTATGDGHFYHTGVPPVTMIGGVKGKAVVSCIPPPIGSYLTEFSADFAVDDNWNGTGHFTVGTDTYKCKVTKVG